MKAKCKIYILFGLLLFTVTSSAQIGVKKKFFFDFRVGGNSSEMEIKDDNYHKKVKLGYHFAVVGAYKVYDDFQVQSGMYMTKKGLKQRIYEDSGENAETGYREVRSGTRNTDANYLLIPLMLGWESDHNKTILFNINAGVYGAWGFNGDTKERGTENVYVGSSSSSSPFSKDYDTFTSANLKKFDYGLMGSIGIVYDFYVLNLSYEWGLSNISNIKDKELQNRNLTLSIGFRF